MAVEGGKKEDRDGDSYTMPLARFVNLYENTDIYMVHTLPESMHGLQKHFVFVNCCSFLNPF